MREPQRCGTVPAGWVILFCKESRMDYVKRVIRDNPEEIAVFKFFAIVGPLALAFAACFPRL